MIAQTIKASAALMESLLNHQVALSALWSDESGGSLLEWVLVAAVLSLCAVASLQTLASKVYLLWQGLENGFSLSI
jgi:Flp pilus assembly pilin Flp